MMNYLNSHNWHPAANLFPLLSGPRLDEMAADIKRKGLLNPIVICDGKVLDGRNRLLACEKAGVEPRFEEFVPTGVGPTAWALSNNFTRRHLKPAQLAGIAAKALPLLREEAKERQRLHGNTAPGRNKQLAPNGAEYSGKAAEQAAAMTGATTRQVERASAIAERDPDMLEQVIAGDISIPEAQRQLGRVGNIAAMNSSWDVEWYTPKKYIEAARRVLGEIDLDPASCERANEVVKAKKFYTEMENGLNPPWPGAVWLNPPYNMAKYFIPKLLDEYREARTTQAITLLSAHRTDSKWFHPLFDHVLCFTNHRIDFINTDEAGDKPPNGSVFVYLGDEPERFEEVFSTFGNVVRRYTARAK